MGHFFTLPLGGEGDYEGRTYCSLLKLFLVSYRQYICLYDKCPWLRESPPDRMYLRFAFQGIFYQYCALPFSLSLSPRVFMQCTKAVIAPLRQQGICLAKYLQIGSPSWRTEGAGHARVRQGIASLASRLFSDTGFAYEHRPVQECGHHTYQPDRLGWCLREADCEGQLEHAPPTISHKFPVAFSGVPLPETFPFIPGSAHPSED